MKTLICAFQGLLCIALISLISSACSSTRKIKTIKEVRSENKELFNQSIDELKKADSLRLAKFSNGKLDSFSNQQISSYIDSLRKISMNHLLDDSIVSRRRINHNSIEFILAKTYRIAQQAKKESDNIKLVNDLLAENTFTQLDIATLFEAGQYKLEGENRQKAIQAFDIIIKNLVSFSEKFPGKKLLATVVIIGYADAQPIITATYLAEVLSNKLGKDNSNKEELNKELSRLRAGSVATVLRQAIEKERSASNRFHNLSIDIVPQGRGEDYPNPAIQDYKMDDIRRRVVNVYWSLIPIFQQPG